MHIFHLTSSVLHPNAKIASLTYIQNELNGIPNLV